MEIEAKPSKKRKLKETEKSKKKPVGKKSKKEDALTTVTTSKKTVSEGDEQWQKFIKLQNPVTTTGKKKGGGKTTTTTTTTTTTASMTKTSSENDKKSALKASKQAAKKKKENKISSLHKHREPCDLMRDEVRSAELNNMMTSVAQINEANHEQMALAVNMMPSRARQTIDTLALGVEQYGTTPPVSFNGMEFSLAVSRRNYEQTAGWGKDHALPLQDLTGDQGFLSINNEHYEHIIKCIIKDKRNDINFAKECKAEAKTTSPATKMLTGGGGGGTVSTANKKLNLIFGNNYHSFGYNMRTPQAQDKKMKAHDIADRERRFKEFFKFDELEIEDETNYGKMPNNFKMFRKLKQENQEKYQRRSETLRLSAALTPKTDVEELSKEYILEFRQPPGTGDALCERGIECVFNKSADKTACYIGKVFYTKREKAAQLRRKVNGDEEEEEQESGNRGRFCYDCLLKSWTIQWAANIRDEVIPERPINYFTVQCKPNQYSPHCMLSVVENDKPTGIVGHVPRFSLNNRRIVTHQRYRYSGDNKHETVSVPVLVETGMDF